MTATTEQRVQLLHQLIHHRPISTAGPQVGMSPSEAHSIATDYGYPNRRRLTTALAELLTDTEEVAEAMAEQSDAELADADPDPLDTEAMRPELPDPEPDVTTQGPRELLARRHEQLDAGHAATATDWSAWWVSRAAMLVERGKASPVAATRKIAAKLDGLPEQLVAGLQADAADAERRAEVAKLRERLAELEAKPANAAPTTATAVIRQWAATNGHTVGKTGRIPADVMDAYRKAHADA